MSQVAIDEKLTSIPVKVAVHSSLLLSFCLGLLLPLSFAPFHLPGVGIISLAFFYWQLINKTENRALLKGLFFGLGFFGLGISWIYVSIYQYGHLNWLLSALITLLFVLYLSLFPALAAVIFNRISPPPYSIAAMLLFSALWVLSEYLRATLLTGFPWLLLGFGQFDAPIRYLLPIIGVYGVSFITCCAAVLLAISLNTKGLKRAIFSISLAGLVMAPTLLSHKHWSMQSAPPLSVGIIQVNLSMRDKWDETLFWQLLQKYQQATEQLMGTDLIVMPESAIPLPASYVSEFLKDIDHQAKQVGSAIVLGIPQPATLSEDYYFNTLIGLGKAKGAYFKQHLVPFGEYIPQPLRLISRWLAIPDANLKPGKVKQKLLKIKGHFVAALICYELAYGDLLRKQLPQAEWIISLSDDGWFGHSLAMYQQQQMAQVRSLQTARYQVVANNDGLSAVIDHQGEIVNALPAFSAGILKGHLLASHGLSPWVRAGDQPILLFSILIVIFYGGYYCRIKKVIH